MLHALEAGQTQIGTTLQLLPHLCEVTRFSYSDTDKCLPEKQLYLIKYLYLLVLYFQEAVPSLDNKEALRLVLALDSA